LGSKNILFILCIPLLSVGGKHEAVIKSISEQGTPIYDIRSEYLLRNSKIVCPAKLRYFGAKWGHPEFVSAPKGSRREISMSMWFVTFFSLLNQRKEAKESSRFAKATSLRWSYDMAQRRAGNRCSPLAKNPFCSVKYLKGLASFNPDTF